MFTLWAEKRTWGIDEDDPDWVSSSNWGWGSSKGETLALAKYVGGEEGGKVEEEEDRNARGCGEAGDVLKGTAAGLNGDENTGGPGGVLNWGTATAEEEDEDGDWEREEGDEASMEVCNNGGGGNLDCCCWWIKGFGDESDFIAIGMNLLKNLKKSSNLESQNPFQDWNFRKTPTQDLNFWFDP